MNSEQPLPDRKTRNLYKGRLSLPCARYFVTCRAVDVSVGLHLPVMAAGIVSALDALQRGGDIRRLCSTIMPDHIHLLFELGERLTVSQIVGKFKTLSQRVENVEAAPAQTAVAASGAPTMGQPAGRLNGGAALAQTAAQGAVACRWQRNFFEHRLRPGEPANNYARYIFMNPYRAGLIGPRAVWPHWRFESTAQFDFLQMLDKGRFPPPVWFTIESDEQLLPTGVEGHH